MTQEIWCLCFYIDHKSNNSSFPNWWKVAPFPIITGCLFIQCTCMLRACVIPNMWSVRTSEINSEVVERWLHTRYLHLETKCNQMLSRSDKPITVLAGSYTSLAYSLQCGFQSGFLAAHNTLMGDGWWPLNLYVTPPTLIIIDFKSTSMNTF